jgi:hypothetical protein
MAKNQKSFAESLNTVPVPAHTNSPKNGYVVISTGTVPGGTVPGGTVPGSIRYPLINKSYKRGFSNI